MDLWYEIKKSYKKPLQVSLFQMGFVHFISLFLEKSTKKGSQESGYQDKRSFLIMGVCVL